MIDNLYVAWKYVTYNKGKTATLVACITLIAFLPLSLELLLNESERQLMSRAESTPLLSGAKGSPLELVRNALYFGEDVPEPIAMETSYKVRDTGLAAAIPLYVRFKARGNPIVGTTPDYFEFRRLQVEKGEPPTVLGDCVVGATAAKRLGLEPGDSLVSSPEDLFDLAGVYPLKMKVTGLLRKAHTSDDLAVFVDLKTAWIIEGLMHGHEDVTETTDESVVLKRSVGNVAANAKLFHYAEITEEKIDSFHFHGDPGSYPITAVIAVPSDEKSGTILRGRYLEMGETRQIVRPADVVEGLLRNIFRIKNVLDAVILLVGLATALAVLLVFALSLRLRRMEIETIFKLGCGRMTTARLLGAEILIIIAFSLLLCVVMTLIVDLFADQLVRTLFIR